MSSRELTPLELLERLLKELEFAASQNRPITFSGFDVNDIRAILARETNTDPSDWYYAWNGGSAVLNLEQHQVPRQVTCIDISAE